MQLIKSHSGFTLIEIMVGTAMLGITSAVIVTVIAQLMSDQLRVEWKTSSQVYSDALATYFTSGAACEDMENKRIHPTTFQTLPLAKFNGPQLDVRKGAGGNALDLQPVLSVVRVRAKPGTAAIQIKGPPNPEYQVIAQVEIRNSVLRPGAAPLTGNVTNQAMQERYYALPPRYVEFPVITNAPSNGLVGDCPARKNFEDPTYQSRKNCEAMGWNWETATKACKPHAASRCTVEGFYTGSTPNNPVLGRPGCPGQTYELGGMRMCMTCR